jgi:predicted regulator of Ras-like GTPase activity (Roadblock/LC7/MglB family)
MDKTDELDERISKCRRIISKDPESLIFAALSEAYRRRGDLNMAAKICNQGLKVHPEYGSAHLVMAKIKMDKRLFGEAERELFLAIKADGRTRANELLLSEILIKKGKREEARTLLDKLLLTDPENPQAQLLLKEIKEKEKMAEAQVKWKEIPAGYEILSELKGKISPTKTLEQILKVPGVLGCLIADLDGLVTESKFKQAVDGEALGAVSAAVFAEIQKNLQKVDFGKLDQTLIESKKLKLWVLRFKDLLMCVCCDHRVNLGYLKIALSKMEARVSFA